MIIDISVPIDDKLPIWPNSPKPKFSKISSIRGGDSANDTEIKMSVHTGTHIDAPLHFIQNGKSVEKLDLKTFFGPVFVVYLPKIKEITSRDIRKLNLPKKTERILFKTENSNLWRKKISKFNKNYVGLTVDAAEWLSKKGVKLVGIDYLSIAKFDEAEEVHKILLEKGIIILEGINLNKVKQGRYQLVCLPVKIAGLEASQTRAILIK